MCKAERKVLKWFEEKKIDLCFLFDSLSLCKTRVLNLARTNKKILIISTGNIEGIDDLIANGNINLGNNDGKTVLHWAAENGNLVNY